MEMVFQPGSEDTESNRRHYGRQEHVPEAVLRVPCSLVKAPRCPERDRVPYRPSDGLGSDDANPGIKGDC